MRWNPLQGLSFRTIGLSGRTEGSETCGRPWPHEWEGPAAKPWEGRSEAEGFRPLSSPGKAQKFYRWDIGLRNMLRPYDYSARTHGSIYLHNRMFVYGWHF